MDYELISYAIGLAIFGGFVWALAVVSFNRGLELGKRMAVAPVSRPVIKRQGLDFPKAMTSDPAIKERMPEISEQCCECGQIGRHHQDCPRLSSKPKPDRRRWMGFSRIKAELENKESA